jgi:uncharacterized protein
LDDQFEFAYAIVLRHGVAVAIAPLFTMDVPIDIVAPPGVAWVLRKMGRLWPRLLYQRTLFVGSPCSEEGSVGMVEGVDLTTIAPMLQPALRARQDDRRLHDCLEGFSRKGLAGTARPVPERGPV